MSSQYLLIASLVAVLASGCASGTLETYKAKNTDETQIVAALMKIQTGIKNKSVEILMQPYADDVYVGNFNKYLGVATDRSVTRVGKRELIQAYSSVFRSVKEISVEIRDFEVIVTGNVATAKAYTDLLTKVEAGRNEEKSQVVRNEVTWRLKRSPLGWKIQEEIYY